MGPAPAQVEFDVGAPFRVETLGDLQEVEDPFVTLILPTYRTRNGGGGAGGGSSSKRSEQNLGRNGLDRRRPAFGHLSYLSGAILRHAHDRGGRSAEEPAIEPLERRLPFPNALYLGQSTVIKTGTISIPNRRRAE